MTDELCDRLYTGLDSIKQLAHTAVTGEPNDVNMFYVLATLMGDGVQMPIIPAANTISQMQSDLATLSSELDESPSFGWVTLSDEESVFDAPKDLWVHEDNTLPMSEAELSVWSDRHSSSPAAQSQLQADFLELAAELFSPDSTLPQLDRDTVFNDFTLLPGTAQPADVFDLAAETSLFDRDDELLPFLSQEPIGESLIANLDIGDDDFLFTDFDRALLPISDDLAPLESSTFSEQSVADLPIAPTVVEPVGKNPPPPPIATTNVSEYQIDTIRVEAKQLDALMGQSGEINVINQQIVSRLGDLELMLELWETGHRDYQHIQAQLQQLALHSPLHRQLQRNSSAVGADGSLN